VEEAEEPAAEAKAERLRVHGLEGERRIVERELLDCVAELLKVGDSPSSVVAG
jgi:hypothetical protein